jgi:hypothetical protein
MLKITIHNYDHVTFGGMQTVGYCSREAAAAHYTCPVNMPHSQVAAYAIAKLAYSGGNSPGSLGMVAIVNKNDLRKAPLREYSMDTIDKRFNTMLFVPDWNNK